MRVDYLLKKRKDRAIAIILSVKEREIDGLIAHDMVDNNHLEDQCEGCRALDRMRKVVLDQLRDFCDMAVDVAMSGEAKNFEFNAGLWEERLAKLDQVLEVLSPDG
jgi:hypothetical protein